MKKKPDLDKLPVFEIDIKDDDESGMHFVSLVEDPAIEMKGMYFSKDKVFEFKTVKDKMKIVGPALIPNKKIYREDDGYGYFVTFSPETIEKMVKKFNSGSNNRSINVDHSSTKVNGYIQENYIIRDSNFNNAIPYGFENLPVGTWFIEVQIEDKEFWDKDVKELGKYGFSVEGPMGMKALYNLYSKKIGLENIIDSMSDKQILELTKIIIK